MKRKHHRPVFASVMQRDKAAKVMTKLRNQYSVLAVMKLLGWELKKRAIISFVEHHYPKTPGWAIWSVLKYYEKHKENIGTLNR